MQYAYYAALGYPGPIDPTSPAAKQHLAEFKTLTTELRRYADKEFLWQWTALTTNSTTALAARFESPAAAGAASIVLVVNGADAAATVAVAGLESGRPRVVSLAAWEVQQLDSALPEPDSSKNPVGGAFNRIY